jgi:capsular polysaccharide biosynthesis protein
MSNDQEDKKGFSARWTAFIRRGHVPILKALHGLAHFSAVHPKMTVCSVIALSVGLFILGIATNFTTNVDEDILVR